MLLYAKLARAVPRPLTGCTSPETAGVQRSTLQFRKGLGATQVCIILYGKFFMKIDGTLEPFRPVISLPCACLPAYPHVQQQQ